jgi:hypothetical protein
VASVRPVCGLLSFAHHGFRLPLISSHWMGSTHPLLNSVMAKGAKILDLYWVPFR